MGWLGKKKSTISSSSAGASSSPRHITQNALAYSGREKVDVRAPYVFHNIINSRGKELIKNNTFSQLSHPQRFVNGCYNIGFYQIAEGKEHQMRPDSTYERQPWTVGIAYNEFNSIRWTRADSETIAHWGIYIRSQCNEAAPNRIFGMNWEKGLGSSLILEDVWGTKGQGKSGNYKKQLKDGEFTKVRAFPETTMYFSLEEFVLEVQWLLHQFIGGRLYTGHTTGIISPHPGAAYSLPFGNCQHFAKQVLTSLKARWTDSQRLSQRFTLSSLESRMLSALKEESVDGYHQLRGETYVMESSRGNAMSFGGAAFRNGF